MLSGPTEITCKNGKWVNENRDGDFDIYGVVCVSNICKDRPNPPVGFQLSH